MTDNTKKTSAAAPGVLPLSDIFFMTLRHWPWILASVAGCLLLATIYLLRTPTVYTRSAEILIKEQSKGQSASSVEDFADMGLFTSKSNLSNEVSVLKSKDLMAEVVERLRLDINYYIKGTFHNTVAYGSNLPLHVDFIDFPADSTASLRIRVARDGALTLSHFRIDGEKADAGRISATLGDTVLTPAGPLVLTATADTLPAGGLEMLVSKSTIAGAATKYASRLKVIPDKDKKSTVLTLQIADQSKQRADDVLSTVIGVYNDSWLRDRNQIAVSTSNFITERLGVIESELGNVDNDISSYKSEHLIPDLQAASSMYMSENQKIAAEMLDLNNQLQMTRYVRSYITADDSRDKLLPANSGISDADINSQIDAYNKTLLQRNALIDKSSVRNPLVVTLNGQLDGQRTAIIATLDQAIVGLQGQISSLRRSESQTTSRLASNPSQAKYLLSVERQQKVKESLYLFLLQKREENELTQAFTAYNTKIVNRPGPSDIPPTPSRSKILAVALLLGLAAPFGYVYLRETLNTRIRGRKDLDGLSVPFLGEIPQIGPAKRISSRREDKEVRRLVVTNDSRDIINEAFRVVRTNLEFMHRSHAGAAEAPKTGADTVVVTSFNPGSGKSFITLNLARALALKGKRVLVIDGDMRNASSSAFVGNPKRGLANYLSGAVDRPADVVIDAPDAPGLSVIPVGAIPPNPTELLESPRLPQLLESLRPGYDYIFIDCPPIEIVADTQIIDRYADRTIFVVRAGLFERTMIPEIDTLYADKKYTSMALILNGTTATRHSYYGYKYGYASYGYGYSYGHKEKN